MSATTTVYLLTIDRGSDGGGMAVLGVYATDAAACEAEAEYTRRYGYASTDGTVRLTDYTDVEPHEVHATAALPPGAFRATVRNAPRGPYTYVDWINEADPERPAHAEERRPGVTVAPAYAIGYGATRNDARTAAEAFAATDPRYIEACRLAAELSALNGPR